MNLWDRAKNMWRLSELQPSSPEVEAEPDTMFVPLVKKPAQLKEVFIPHIKHDPIKELVHENQPIPG